MPFEYQLVEGKRCIGCGKETKEHNLAINMFESEKVIGYLCDDCETLLVAFEASLPENHTDLA